MNYTIERAKQGDENVLAYIQTESWKAAFRDILDFDTLKRCTDPEKAAAMYRKLLERNVGNGYVLKVDGMPHCIAWWDAARDDNWTGYAELICIHSLKNRWREGYGSRMMETVLQDIAGAGYKRVMLWVFKDNVRVRRFYEAQGFTTEEKQKPGIVPVEICYEKML